MKRIFITGYGLNTERINNVSALRDKNIDQFNAVERAAFCEDYLKKDIPFQCRDIIAREGRSLLNAVSKLVIDAIYPAFNMAEKQIIFSKEEKKSFPIFIAPEVVEYNLFCLDQLSCLLHKF